MPSPLSNLARTLMTRLTEAGMAVCETAVLQPADVFVNLLGEELRRRMVLTSALDGTELCLRPDLTIPTALEHLASGAGTPTAYCYQGPVFRQRAAGPAEIAQAGLEFFGHEAREKTDATVMAQALFALESAGVRSPIVRLGDLGIQDALLDALGLENNARRRVERALSRPQGEPAPLPVNGHYGALLDALSGLDRTAARALIEDVLALAGIEPVGGRSPADIAERMLAQAGARDTGADALTIARTLTAFRAIDCPARDALSQISKLAEQENLQGLAPALAAFAARLDALDALGVDVGLIRYEAAFTRRLDYYTGMMFEIEDRSLPGHGPLVAGGRYDGLFSSLGAPAPLPAVGCAFWLERIVEAAA